MCDDVIITLTVHLIKELCSFIKARSHPERKYYEKDKDHLYTWTGH